MPQPGERRGGDGKRYSDEPSALLPINSFLSAL